MFVFSFREPRSQRIRFAQLDQFIDRHAERIPTPTAMGPDFDAGAIVLLERYGCRAREWKLKHERSAVVGDAAHDIEPAGRARPIQHAWVQMVAAVHTGSANAAARARAASG